MRREAARRPRLRLVPRRGGHLRRVLRARTRRLAVSDGSPPTARPRAAGLHGRHLDPVAERRLLLGASTACALRQSGDDHRHRGDRRHLRVHPHTGPMGRPARPRGPGSTGPRQLGSLAANGTVTVLCDDGADDDDRGQITGSLPRPVDELAGGLARLAARSTGRYAIVRSAMKTPPSPRGILSRGVRGLGAVLLAASAVGPAFPSPSCPAAPASGPDSAAPHRRTRVPRCPRRRAPRGRHRER